MEAKKHHFTNLRCWQKGAELRRFLYSISNELPEKEKYNLVNQIRRAAISITSNIAEGYGRFHYQENIQFCRQSRASIYECEDHLISCFDEGYINQDIYNKALILIVDTRKILDGYITYLIKELRKSKIK